MLLLNILSNKMLELDVIIHQSIGKSQRTVYFLLQTFYIATSYAISPEIIHFKALAEVY